MKKSTFYCLLAALCLYMNSQGQIKQLHIGDEVPALQLTNVLNHSNLPLQLPSPNGKAIILDFFATWCGGCIKELPRLAALQDSLHGQLQIVLVSREPKEKLEPFLQKRTVAKAFPIIYADTALHGLFPNRILPHDVWIGPGGVVKAITDGSAIELTALQRLLRAEILQLPLKKDLMDFHIARPLLMDGNGPEETLLYRSSFTRHIEGAPSAVGRQTENGRIRLYQLNQWLPSMFATAWKTSLNRLVTELPPTDPFWRNAQNKSNTGEKYYSYELSATASTDQRMLDDMMRQDLCRYTGYQCQLENRKVAAFRIVPFATGSAASPANTAGMPVHVEDPENYIWLHQQSITVLAKRLNEYFAKNREGPQFIADSVNEHLVDVRLHTADLADMDRFKKALKAQGLALEPCFIESEMLVIRRPDSTISFTN